MKRILIIFAHPLTRRSRVNRAMVAAVRGMEGITFHELYEAYPDFYIDVKREQALLVQHDVVVFQHPFYWYSTPAIMKQWQDLVLEHGFAYGSEGTALKDKPWLHAISCGGGEEAYRSDGFNRFTVRQLLAPLEQTAHLCNCHYLPPFVVQGTFELTDEALNQHVVRYQALLEALRDDRLDMDRLAHHELMPDPLPLY